MGHGADVGAAQHRVGPGEGAEFGGHGLGAGQADGGVGDGQPAVGFLGEVGAEAEGLGQGELGAVEAGHDVLGAAPVVDGLGGVADHDELGVVALAEEDLFDDGVGVLGLVQQQEVGVDPGLGEGPHFQVVVVVEADRAVVGVLQVAPGFAGEGHDVGGELGVQVVVFQAAQAGTWWRVMASSAVWQKRATVRSSGVGEGLLGDVALADADGFGDAEGLAGLPGRAAGGVQAAGVAVADGGVGQGVGGLALDGGREAGGGVLGDGPVEGEVAAAARGGRGRAGPGWWSCRCRRRPAGPGGRRRGRRRPRRVCSSVGFMQGAASRGCG